MKKFFIILVCWLLATYPADAQFVLTPGTNIAGVSAQCPFGTSGVDGCGVSTGKYFGLANFFVAAPQSGQGPYGNKNANTGCPVTTSNCHPLQNVAGVDSGYGVGPTQLIATLTDVANYPGTGVQANGTWTTGAAQTITLGAPCPTVNTGGTWLVYDLQGRSGANPIYLGQVSACTGISLTLVANPAHASIGSTDNLAMGLYGCAYFGASTAGANGAANPYPTPSTGFAADFWPTSMNTLACMGNQGFGAYSISGYNLSPVTSGHDCVNIYYIPASTETETVTFSNLAWVNGPACGICHTGNTQACPVTGSIPGFMMSGNVIATPLHIFNIYVDGKWSDPCCNGATGSTAVYFSGSTDGSNPSVLTANTNALHAGYYVFGAGLSASSIPLGLTSEATSIGGGLYTYTTDLNEGVIATEGMHAQAQYQGPEIVEFTHMQADLTLEYSYLTNMPTVVGTVTWNQGQQATCTIQPAGGGAWGGTPPYTGWPFPGSHSLIVRYNYWNGASYYAGFGHGSMIDNGVSAQSVSLTNVTITNAAGGTGTLTADQNTLVAGDFFESAGISAHTEILTGPSGVGPYTYTASGPLANAVVSPISATATHGISCGAYFDYNTVFITPQQANDMTGMFFVSTANPQLTQYVSTQNNVIVVNLVGGAQCSSGGYVPASNCSLYEYFNIATSDGAGATFGNPNYIAITGAGSSCSGSIPCNGPYKGEQLGFDALTLNINKGTVPSGTYAGDAYWDAACSSSGGTLCPQIQYHAADTGISVTSSNVQFFTQAAAIAVTALSHGGFNVMDFKNNFVDPVGGGNGAGVLTWKVSGGSGVTTATCSQPVNISGNVDMRTGSTDASVGVNSYVGSGANGC